jgi:hypothetical protein
LIDYSENYTKQSYAVVETAQICDIRRGNTQIDTRIRGPTAPMHLGLKERTLCAPLLVSPVISRGAPRQTT